MQVRLSSSYGPYRAGAVVELPEAVAARLLTLGRAEPAEPPTGGKPRPRNRQTTTKHNRRMPDA